MMKIWEDVQSDLQRLISCLPDKKGGVIVFNTTGVLIPSSGVFFEKGPVTITSLAGRISESQEAIGLPDKVVFSCPDAKDNLSFMEVRSTKTKSLCPFIVWILHNRRIGLNQELEDNIKCTD